MTSLQTPRFKGAARLQIGNNLETWLAGEESLHKTIHRKAYTKPSMPIRDLLKALLLPAMFKLSFTLVSMRM